MPKYKVAEWIIKNTLREKNIGYGYVCKELGICEKEFSKCMEGKKKLKASEFMSLCIFLGLKVSDFR